MGIFLILNADGRLIAPDDFNQIHKKTIHESPHWYMISPEHSAQNWRHKVM